jgi:hypothetical protein
MDRNKIYHKLVAKFDTEDISEGKLTGTTDTDYFYFLCPKCDGGGSQIMRIINYGQLPEKDFKYAELKPKVTKSFQFCFELYCPRCKLHTVVKLSNEGKQDGKITDWPNALPNKVIGPNRKT